MPKSELEDLLATVEALRLELHPKLDGVFLQAVVRAEEENPEDDALASQAIERALKKSLKVEGSR